MWCSCVRHPWNAERPLRCRKAASPGAHLAAASGFDAWVVAPDALTIGHVGELAGDLLAVRLVIAADLADKGAGAVAGASAPCGELVGGCGYRQWLELEDVFGALPEQRIDGAAVAADAGFGRSWPAGKDVDLIEIEQALGPRRCDDAPVDVPVGTSDPAGVRGPVRC
jgi:hypothetical protein